MKEPNWQAIGGHGDTDIVGKIQIPHSFLHKECGVSFLIE